MSDNGEHGSQRLGSISASVIIPTFNRSDSLPRAIECALNQAGVDDFEVIVVDNNSSDRTRQVVERFSSSPRVRYVLEKAQGVSHARNRGVRESRGRVLVFHDDDVWPRADWLTRALEALRTHPEASYVGGRVLPVWPSVPPAWLDQQQWGPLALFDYGPSSKWITAEQLICIGACNLACRREAFLKVGGFDARYQHRPGAASAVEDHEWQLRAAREGLRGLYEPELVIDAPIHPSRLSVAYHRKWHLDHGRAVAALDGAHRELEQSIGMGRRSERRFIPRALEPWLMREIVTASIQAVGARLSRQETRAIHAGLRLRELVGYSIGRAEASGQ